MSGRLRQSGWYRRSLAFVPENIWNKSFFYYKNRTIFKLFIERRKRQ